MTYAPPIKIVVETKRCMYGIEPTREIGAVSSACPMRKYVEVDRRAKMLF
jgi:hypothetical protein